MTEIIELGKFGLIGLFLSLVGLIFYIIKVFVGAYTRLSENHIAHNQAVISENTKATAELTSMVREVKDILIRQRG